MANISNNKDIDYIQKDFNSVVDAIISFANVNFGPGTSANRLWTDFNADSFSRNWLEIVAFVSDGLYFYLDNQATQTYLQTATVRSAIKNIAKQFGFVPATATSASGTVQFVLNAAGTIPRGTRLQSSTGVNFFLTTDIVAPAAGTYTGSVLQGQIVTETFTAEGLQNEEFNLRGPNVIRDQDNLNPADVTPQISVSGNSYQLVDSFIRHTGEDAPAIEDSLGNIIGGGGRVFLLDERPDGTPFIRFGDGVFGRKLNPGETLTITYRTGGGSSGNIAAESLNTLLDSIGIVDSVINPADFSGGADEQSIEQLRELIPASLRTLDRAVTQQDHSDLLVSSFSEVFAASTEANTTDPGVDLNVYVVPQGSGIQKISDNLVLRNRLSTYLDRRKMVTIQFQISDAFGVDVLIGLEIFISDTASKTTVERAINTALLDFFSLNTGGPDGNGVGFAQQILIKDICNIVEDIDGVERFEIRRLTYRPRVQENVVGLVTTYNTSAVTVFPNVQEREWLLAASGSSNETAGGVLFNNDSAIGYTYDSGTGEITYNFPVDLFGVAPGDQFTDGASATFTILAVDTVNSIVTIPEGQTVNTTPGAGVGGSIRNGATSFQSYKVWKKILGTATNLAVDSITDNNLDLVQESGTGSQLSARVLLDNSNVFRPGEFATGDFYLVDASSNVWEIVSNDSNTLTTSITAVNDASISSVSAGPYKIVTKLTGNQVIFNNNIFTIQYNSDTTIISTGAQFSQIGTIGDAFEIAILQTNQGRLGVALDLITYTSSDGKLRLNGAPDLQGLSTDDVLIDNTGQIFKIVGVDNIPKPSIQYEATNFDKSVILEDSALGSQLAQGFQVSTSDTYAVVSAYLKREGNILGNLTARIVDDDGSGLPDLSSVISVSQPVPVSEISDTAFEKVFFGFNTPPTLAASTQYHIVVSADAGYASSEQSDVEVFNSTTDAYTYSPSTGVIQYSGTVNLSLVQPGHFWEDNSGNLYSILSVSDDDDTITIADGLSPDDSGTNSRVIINDRVLFGIDASAPTYADGEFSVFDGVSQWSNSTGGPNDFTTTPYTASDGSTFTEADSIFSVEGTKSVTIDSNLTPQLGAGATVSRRYYDDENQISLVLGIATGTATSATDVNSLAIGTVASVPNRPVDNFVFRTSRFSDDVVNLRLNEIPELAEGDIELTIFGGVD
jgi:hypothetical protein